MLVVITNTGKEVISITASDQSLHFMQAKGWNKFQREVEFYVGTWERGEQMLNCKEF